jgi:hypothetical protein
MKVEVVDACSWIFDGRLPVKTPAGILMGGFRSKIQLEF